MAGAGLAGAVLRLWNLPAQVLAGDEMWTLRAVLREPARRLLTTFHQVDVSIPMAFLYRVVSDAGIALSELLLRSLPLVAGLALPVLVPLAAAGLLGWRRAAWLAWLLALSPLPILYSRIVRPYSWVILLSGLALFAFARWWRGGRWPWAALYAGAAALATWMLSVAGPFVAAPLLFGLGDVIRRPGPRRNPACWLRLAAPAAAAATLLVAALLPALPSLVELVRVKSGMGRAGGATWLAALQLLAGTESGAVAVLFWGVVAVGLVAALRRHRRLAVYLLLPVAVQVAAVTAVSPLGVNRAFVLARYLLPALPAVLALVAMALAPIPAGGRRRALAGGAAVVLFLVLLAATGPFADRTFRNSPFMHHKEYVALHVPEGHPPEERVPAVYRTVLPALDGGAVLEYPWNGVWQVARAFRAYQERHGRDVLVGTIDPGLRDPRLALRNAVPGTPEGFLASRARYLVVHLDYPAEERRVEEPAGARWPDFRPPAAARLRHLGRRTGRLLEKGWGPPDYRDGQVLLWDLERVRRARWRTRPRRGWPAS